MKNIIRFLIFMVICAVSLTALNAEEVKGKTKSMPKAGQNCLPATNSNELNLNNVRAYVKTNGRLWKKENAEYEIPKGSGKKSLYAGSLWIGGRDASGQLRLAAVTFNQSGEDFFSGPLKKQDATITQSDCKKWDRLFAITRQDVVDFKAYISNDKIPPYEGYSVPRIIKEWPAHPFNNTPNDWHPGEGPVPGGQSSWLAPFYDRSGDGIYDYNDGDYPYYDLTNALCPWTPDNVSLAAQHKLPLPHEDATGAMGMIYADHVLKGDQTLYWIFNDKGDAHTESGGSSIGLEIRAQAFEFATNDELNNMTFYSYEIINRSTYVLRDCYFGAWCDPDLGYAYDDYVGCDVARGLGYCYNGTDVDGNGQVEAYGNQPPAVGVDFFQGPYIDNDGRDNPKFSLDSAILALNVYCGKFLNSAFPVDQMAINGVNFGDSIVDNERFGMRRFVYYDNNSSNRGNPSTPEHYYNYLRGIWKDNVRMRYGGNGLPSGTTSTPECDFMFPGTSDPCNWGTQGLDPNINQYGQGGWTESNVGNPPYDRRFIQSAGPFTLKAGSVNYVTVGIPWARATSGGALASVELLKIADDKCQSLFENCFKLLEGPDAPDLTIKEFENELIIYIENGLTSNNYKEGYNEVSNVIPEHFSGDTTHLDRKYRFEGYKIYQLSDKSVSVTDLNDADKARLIAQCDLKNFRANGTAIGQLINWVYDEKLHASVATEMVDGANNGIFHTISIKEDAFAKSDNKALVNHKTYYFLALAYSYNEFYPFSLDANGLKGQQTPYLAGRNNIKVVSAIPHKPLPQEYGTSLQSSYGDQPEISRIEGQGNGGYFLDLTEECRENILKNNKVQQLDYKKNAGPLGIKVIDPLKVRPYDYYIRIKNNESDITDNAMWEISIVDQISDSLLKALGFTNGIIKSERAISIHNEQLIPELGIAVSLENSQFALDQEEAVEYITKYASYFRGYNWVNYSKYAQVSYVGSSITYKDKNHPWLNGVKDTETNAPDNWIRAGNANGGFWNSPFDDFPIVSTYARWRTEDFFEKVSYQAGGTSAEDYRLFKDYKGLFESTINGTWAPYLLSSPFYGGPHAKYVTPDTNYTEMPGAEPLPSYYDFRNLTATLNQPGYNQTMTNLYSVDIVLTDDKDKWTRCVVLEACDDSKLSVGNALAHEPRKAKSVDKNGNKTPEGIDYPSSNPNDPNYISANGMGWFPGYAVNVETGERLNIMFSENSSDPKNNGADMLFNPTDVYGYLFVKNLSTGHIDTTVLNAAQYNANFEQGLYENKLNHFVYGGTEIWISKPIWGGKHYIYVCGSSGNTCGYIQSARPIPGTLQARNFNDGNVVRDIVWGGYITDVLNGNQLPFYDCGAYDAGLWLMSKFKSFVGLDITLANTRKLKMQLFNNVMWTSIPMSVESQKDHWLKNEALIKLRVSRPYLRYSSRWYDSESQAPAEETALNGGFPMYKFSTKSLAPVAQNNTLANSILNEINIVPNPYYAFSTYETTNLETYVKIVNLPDNCDISIYTVGGILIKTFAKNTTKNDMGNGITYVDWDLKNNAGIPISGGMYIIHVKAKGIGERTLKFFCAMRPVDLNAF